MKKHKIVCYDNNGKSFDRYTIIIDKYVFGMSSNALSPQGFNQFCCEKHELNCDNLGEKIQYKNLPNDVKQAIKERIME